VCLPLFRFYFPFHFISFVGCLKMDIALRGTNTASSTSTTGTGESLGSPAQRRIIASFIPLASETTTFSLTGLHHAVSLGNIEVSTKVRTQEHLSEKRKPQNTTKCAASEINFCRAKSSRKEALS